MTTFRRITGVFLAAALFSGAVRGQDVRIGSAVAPYLDEREGLGLDDAIRRALEREPALRAARNEIEVARAERQQAGLRPNPALTFEHRIEPRGTDRLTTIGVEWPLDVFRRQGRVQEADQDLAVTRLAVADRERALAGDVRIQYGVAAAAARDVSVAADLVATVQRQLDVARARASEGAIPSLDRDRLDVEVRRLQAERVRASSRADVAIIQLKQLLGMSPDESLLLRESLEALVNRTVDAAAGRATPLSSESRPDVLEAGARVALAGARVDKAQREGRVEISLFGTYMRMDMGFPQQGFNSSGALERIRGRFNYVAGGATISLPLANRNQGQIAAAQAERAGAEARRDAAALAARSEIAAAEARDTRAREAVALYSGGARTLARQNLDVMRQTFDLGRGTVVEVLAEQRRYLEFEQAYTAALREAWEARAILTRALGEAK